MKNYWLSVAKIYAYLGIKRDAVYKWITEKELPAHLVGKLWKFKISEVDEWVRNENNYTIHKSVSG